MTDFAMLRAHMVERQVEARGVRSPLVLDAMRAVPRERFVPERMREFAYEDSPLPIDAEQTISQPYIVALMVEALNLEGGERVLEIGAGSGYAAAVISRIAGEVYAVERIGQLAEKAAQALSDAGCDNVHILHGDGTLGWPEHAPYDAIVVAAGGPEVPDSLKEQLAIGGRLVIPVGPTPRAQELVRVTRMSEDDFKSEDLADVRFVPLLGDEGWKPEDQFLSPGVRRPIRPRTADATAAEAIYRHCEPFEDIDHADLDPLLARIGEARVVLIGEASHGTSDFYRMRNRITRALIEDKGFDFVAIEGDWPDVARIDHYARHSELPPKEWTAFARFPTWMWRNADMRDFVDWLHRRNRGRDASQRTAIYGLDIYSLYTSIRAVLAYLDDVDPEAAAVARERYGCLTPWQADPATYGHAALTGGYRNCEKAVLRTLREILEHAEDYGLHDGARFLDAAQNARLVANAERYYRVMYYGSRESWNLRDRHMHDTLTSLLDFHGPRSRAVVWAHNSHIGDAAATEMSARGEFNIGHLCREALGFGAYSIGMGTHTGTVAAASDWDGPMEVKRVRPSIEGSYERLCHQAGTPRFLLPLRDAHGAVAEALARPRLERAIGVIYRPETEMASHYFQARLLDQFDEFVWLDRTEAVVPIPTAELAAMPDTYPFGV